MPTYVCIYVEDIQEDVEEILSGEGNGDWVTELKRKLWEKKFPFEII